MSALTGTFSGKLTADAIDAVGNITIGSNAVATTTVATVDKKTTKKKDKEVFSLAWLVRDGEAGVSEVAIQYSAVKGAATAKDGDGNYHQWITIRIFLNEKKLLESQVDWWEASDGSPCFFSVIANVGVGSNTISMEIEDSATVRGVLAKCDHIRKL